MGDGPPRPVPHLGGVTCQAKNNLRLVFSMMGDDTADKSQLIGELTRRLPLEADESMSTCRTRFVATGNAVYWVDVKLNTLMVPDTIATTRTNPSYCVTRHQIAHEFGV